MVSRSRVLTLVEGGMRFEEIGLALDISPGLAYLVATGMAADGSGGWSPEDLERVGAIRGSTQHLLSPPRSEPTDQAVVAEWILRLAHSDGPMRAAAGRRWVAAAEPGPPGRPGRSGRSGRSGESIRSDGAEGAGGEDDDGAEVTAVLSRGHDEAKAILRELKAASRAASRSRAASPPQAASPSRAASRSRSRSRSTGPATAHPAGPATAHPAGDGSLDDLVTRRAAIDDLVTRRAAIADLLVARLSAHEAAEQQLFWPAVADTLDGGPSIAQLARQQENEGKQVLDALRKLAKVRGAGPDPDRFDDLVEQLAELLRRHMAFEEAVFVRLRETVPERARRQLGVRMRRALSFGPTRPHPLAPSGAAALHLAGPMAAAVDRLRDRAGRRPASRIDPTPDGGTGR